MTLIDCAVGAASPMFSAWDDVQPCEHIEGSLVAELLAAECPFAD